MHLDPSTVTLADVSLPATAPAAEVFEVYKKYGAVIIKGNISKEAAVQMKAELQPALDAQAPEAGGDEWMGGGFFPPTTRRVSGLLVKSKTFVEELVLNKQIYDLAANVLTTKTLLRTDHEKKWSTVPPQYNVGTIFELHPGGERQSIHRDDMVWHNVKAEAAEWTPGHDYSITTLTALSPAVPENGGTLFIPGSHLWGEDRVPKYEECLAATMDIGDTIIISGRIHHAGGTNSMKRGDPDSVRTMAVVSYNCGWLRQEENQYVIVMSNPEVAKTLPREVLERAGFNVALPFCGFVDYASPLKVLGYTGEDLEGGDHLVFDPDQ